MTREEAEDSGHFGVGFIFGVLIITVILLTLVQCGVFDIGDDLTSGQATWLLQGLEVFG